MRKWLWGCGAVVLAGAGWFSWHTYHYPDSFLGRCTHEACVLSLRCNPLLALKGQLLQKSEAGLVRDLGEASVISGLLADPIPVEPVPADLDGQRLAAWIELPGGNPPAGPAPIVIQEEEPIQAPGEKVVIQAEESPLAEGVDLLAPGPLCPRQMPYCYDDETHPERMPRADEETDVDELLIRVEEKGGPLASWLDFFFGSHLDSIGGGEEEAEPPLSLPSENSSEQPPSSHCPAMDSHSGCPGYYGPCTPRSPVMQTPYEGEEQEAGSKPTPNTRGRQPRLPPSFRKALFEDTDLAEPTVDTMEYRSSDRTFGDYGHNPY